MNRSPEERSQADESPRRSGRRRRRRSPSPRHTDEEPRRKRKSRRKRRHYSESYSEERHQNKQQHRTVSDDDDEKTLNPPVKETESSDRGRDDSIGHFRGGKDSVVADRYKILREVGLGTFGRVVECLDLKRRKEQKAFVAIKIVRKIQRYYESATVEAKIIYDINRRGGRGVSHCVVLHDSFNFQGHYCMVFESLGPSLYDFLKRHNYRPFPMICIQDFLVQLLEALEFLHSHQLIHTDLKIENILLTNDRTVHYRGQVVPQTTRLKLIDFGGACYDHDKKSAIINTRQYRAPEVILGTGWSMPSDVWSLGCVLMELYHGELLFATHDSVEHLGLMETIVGHFPRHMVMRGKTEGRQMETANQAFDSNGRHRMSRVLSPAHADYVRDSPRLNERIRSSDDAWFMDLIHRMLVIDPEERSTAHECLQFLARIGRNYARFR